MVSTSWLSSRLRQARFLSGLTIEAVASAIDTSNTTIWRYEAGQRRPSGPTLHALASVYGKSVDWLRGETDEDGEAPGSTDAPAPDSPEVTVELEPAAAVQSDSDDSADSETARLVQLYRRMPPHVREAWLRMAEAMLSSPPTAPS